MSRTRSVSWLLSVLLSLMAASVGSVACSSAYADRPAPARQPASAPLTALAMAPEPVRAPFDVTLLGEDGAPMATFGRNGKYYVLGDTGERYVIRVTNPTPRRVEAVITVDGLDVIDGEAGDVGKRGYIVPPYGDLRVEGFRTSASEVATFRFSTVGGSYAGKKGKARNVGVIAVALFEEQAAPEIVDDDRMATLGEEQRPYDGRPGPGARGRRIAPVAPRVSDAGGGHDAAKKADASERRMPADPSVGGAPSDDCCAPQAPSNQRLGLGTEFGEQRSSAASYTRFVRAAAKPMAIAELRYNDRPGLAALGIPVAPTPDDQEVMLRETADPFPGERFAQPPMR
jgi:hypothetical protein